MNIGILLIVLFLLAAFLVGIATLAIATEGGRSPTDKKGPRFFKRKFR